MSGRSAGEDLAGEGDTDGTHSPDATTEESPEVATAKAMAATRIEAAGIARSIATRKDLFIGLPIMVACVIGGELVILNGMTHDNGGNPRSSIAWLALCAGALLILLAVGGFRLANRRGEFEEVCRVEEFNVTAASLKYDQKPDAP